MDSSKQKAASFEEEQSFSVREYLTTCLGKWKWFVASVIVFLCLGYLYALRQAPVYSRTMSVLIKNPESGGGFDMGNAFSQFGFGGGNTNVNNELISMTSPAVISEVARRLALNVNMTKKGTFHGTVLFGSNNPVLFEYPELTESTSCSFRIDLNPDNSYRLYKFLTYDEAGDKVKSDKEVKGRLGDNPVATPVGRIYLRPNAACAGKRSEPWTIFVSVASYAWATEYYSSRIKGDLADSDAEVINLSIDDSNVERANAVLNTTLDVYSEYWATDKNKVNVATSKFINDRLAMISRELGEVDTRIADYQSKNRMPDLESTSRMYVQEASEVSADILQVNNQLSMARYIRDYISNPGNTLSVIPVNTGMGSAALEAQIREYNQVLLNRGNLVQNSSAQNPLVRDYDAQLAGMRESIHRSLNAQVGSLESTLRTLEGAKGVSDNRLSAAPDAAKTLGSIKREQTVMESLYLYLLQKREETDLSQAFTASNVRVITPPYGSRRPISPRKGVIMMICFILGAAIPAALIYMMVLSNDTVSSRKDLENLPIPFTGEIPHVGKKNALRNYLRTKKQRQKEIDKPKPIVAEGKRDVPNEAFRVVRSNVDLMLGKGSDEKVIMVTSFNPGSGKSFVAFNLGASFALKRKRVLMIDGDLRHGSLSTYVDSPRKGLSAFLTGATDDVRPLVKKVDGFEDLFVLPIGHRPPNPAELLETDRFGEMLAQLKPDFDLIMVDCPPVNVVVDTQLLNRYADRTIFVVRAGLLKRSAVRDLVTLYNEKKLKRMSLLLNGTEEGHSSYYTYGNYQGLE